MTVSARLASLQQLACIHGRRVSAIHDCMQVAADGEMLPSYLRIE